MSSVSSVATINEYVVPVKRLIELYHNNNKIVDVRALQRNVNISLLSIPRINAVTLHQVEFCKRAAGMIPKDHHRAALEGEGLLLRMDVKYANAFGESAPFTDYIYLP